MVSPSIIGELIADRASLSRIMQSGAPHLRSIAAAIRDQQCDFALIMQNSGPFEFPQKQRPVIALVGDDMDRALGPSGFHAASLRRVLARCSGAAVVSSGPDPRPYEQAATTAVLGRKSVMIVETRPEQEIPWVDFIRTAAPDIGLVICSPNGGRA